MKYRKPTMTEKECNIFMLISLVMMAVGLLSRNLILIIGGTIPLLISIFTVALEAENDG